MNARRPTSPRTGTTPSPGTSTRTSSRAGGSRPTAPTPTTTRRRTTAAPKASTTRPANTRGTARRSSRVEFNTRNNGTVSVSWRTIVFVLVLAVAFVLVTPTLRHFLRQQETERRITDEVVAVQARTEELEREIARWDDADFVRTQARDRLGFVMPGQQPYIVVDPEAVIGEEAQQAYEEEMGIAAPIGPWYLEVWDSIEVAGETPAEGAIGRAVAPPRVSPEEAG